MRPRAVRRPATATALKKKAPPEAKEEEPKQDETQEVEHEQEVENEFSAPVYYDVDRSERLELEDNDPPSEAEEDAAGANLGEREMEIKEEGGGEEAQEGAELIEEEELEGGEEDEFVDGEEEIQHDVAQERRKRKEFEVFVGGLDREVTDEDLRRVFGQVGEVTEVRLMKNPLTQKNKGFAFLRFATVEQARRAFNELKHPTINGKQCGVSPSQDSDALFVGNICKTWTKEMFKEKLAKYGVDKFEDLTLVEDGKNEGMNRGFAFLDFPSRSEALEACKHLHKRDVLFGTDRTAKVAFADTFIEPDDEIMSQVKTVFLDGLPATWDENRVKDHLRKFGKIEKVELARNMPAAKRTDFGFITFDTHDAAVACVEGMNNAELGEGKKKVKVRARLSRPRQRGRSGRNARGSYLIGHNDGRGGRARGVGFHMDSGRFAGHSGRGIQGHTFSGAYKRALGPRDAVPDRMDSRRRLPPPERSLDQRSPVSAYGKVSSKRDYVRHEETFPGPSGFAARDTAERRSSYRDVYPSRGSDYLDSPLRSDPHNATRRSALYAEESYSRHMERPSSYRDNHSRGYNSTSGTKRHQSVMDDLHPWYAESTGRPKRARYDYAGNTTALQHGESEYYATERLGHSSHLGYDTGSRSSAGHSHGLYETRTSSMAYSRGGVSRDDGGGMYSSYGRDYISSAEDLGTGSYSSTYPIRGLGDGYSSGRVSGSYY